VKRSLLFFFLGLILPAVILLALAWTGSLPVRATDRPSHLETRIAMHAMDARVAKEARGISNPMPADTANLFDGMRLYKDDCAGCHGMPGKPSAFGRNFYPHAPQFSEDYDMEPGESFVVVKQGVRYTGMAAWDGIIPDSDIWKVVTFLTHVKTLPPAVAAEWRVATAR
jgi:mono/diheme cytochrome c family protein